MVNYNLHISIKKSIEKILSKVKNKALLDEAKRLLSHGAITFLAYSDNEFLFEISDSIDPTKEGKKINITTGLEGNVIYEDSAMDVDCRNV